MGFWGWAFHQAMRGRLARFADDLRNPARAQGRRLAAMLRANRDTEFGRAHGFGELLNMADARALARAYRTRVPVRDYADFEPLLARMRNGGRNVLLAETPTLYNLTSGSTSRPKHCPVNRAFTVEHHNMHLLWMYHFQRAHPEVVPGPYFTVVSPAESGVAPDGTPDGSSSGRQAQDQAWIIRRRQAVPYDVCRLHDYAARRYATLAFALAKPLRAAVSVNPSTLALLGQTLHEHAEALIADVEAGNLALAAHEAKDDHDRALLAALARTMRPDRARARSLRGRLRADGGLWPRNAWPELAAIATWQGGSAPFYAERVKALWGDAPMRCLGWRASEGTFSIPLADGTASGPLAVGGAFFEFVPVDAPWPPAADAVLLADELAPGRSYRAIVTTSGGLYRYDLGDVVEATGMRDATPEVRFTHRAGGVLSATGEKVTEAQVVLAMTAASRDGPGLTGFAATLEYPAGGGGGARTPRYVLAVEWRELPPGAAAARTLARNFDRALAEVNPEYAGKRADGRLSGPVVFTLASGDFARQRRATVEAGRPDGQVKPPHLFAPSGIGAAPVRPCPFFDHVTIVARGEMPIDNDPRR